MGYRSDVVLMAVFANAEQHDEVMAVYSMDDRVQKLDLEKAWRRVDLNRGEVARIYQGDDVKWYESYDDVQGLEYLATLLDTFHLERGFDYAWGHARVGEEFDDVVYDTGSPDTPLSSDLIDIVYENLTIARRVETGF